MAFTLRDLAGLDVDGSSPLAGTPTDAAFVARLRSVARWSDVAGCRGILLFTDNHAADPWVLAQDVIGRTNALAPLVCVQTGVHAPVRRGAEGRGARESLWTRRRREFVAGGFQFDLAALGDQPNDDDRYERVTGCGTLIASLLTSDRVTFVGRLYNVFGLKLDATANCDILPRMTVSGSSAAGRKCAASLGATAPDPSRRTGPAR